MKKTNMLILLGFLSLSVLGSAKTQQIFEEKNYSIEMTKEKSELISESNSGNAEENGRQEQNLFGKKRKKVEGTPLSAFIPCYNDGATIETTLKSLYANYPHELLEVFVINDKSTDNSLAILEKLNQSYPFHLINNKENLGKSKSLNEIIPSASHATLLIIDADTKISKANIADMLKRKV